MSPRLSPLRTLPARGLELVTFRVSRFGERRSLDWLTYNPLQLYAYHRVAQTDAPGVIPAILEVFPRARRLADIGAGSGAFAVEFRRRGRSVEACEYSWAGRLYARLQKVSCHPLDLRRDPPTLLQGSFDLAYCFEVAEHCPATLGDRLVELLAKTAPLVVFTAAPPGQGGLGHVNEQEPSYWTERFTEHGMRHDTDHTSELRDAFTRWCVRSPWFTENLMVFESE